MAQGCVVTNLAGRQEAEPVCIPGPSIPYLGSGTDGA